MREHKLKYGYGFVGVHCRSYTGPELNMSPSHARVSLKRLDRRRIIELKNAQKNPGYEFAVKFVNREHDKMTFQGSTIEMFIPYIL